MFNIFLRKTLCQLGILFAAAQLFASLFDSTLNFYAAAVVYIAALVISFCLRARAWYVRVLPLLLVGVLLPFASTVDWVFAIVPITAYAGYVMVSGGYTIDNDTFREAAPVGIFAVIVLAFFTLLTGGAGMMFLFICVVCGILLSQDLRHDIDTNSEPVYLAMSYGVMLPVVGFTLVMGTTAVRGFITGAAVRIWQWLILQVPEEIAADWIPDLPEVQQEYMPPRPRGALMEAFVSFFEDLVYLQAGAGVIATLAALFAIVFWIALTVFIARKIMKAKGKAKDERDYRHEDAGGTTHAYKYKTPRRLFTGHNGTVRRYYRRFMKLLLKREATLPPGYTSGDIENVSARVLGDGGRDLRDVYIRARYSEDTLTRKDAAAAKDSYARLSKT